MSISDVSRIRDDSDSSSESEEYIIRTDELNDPDYGVCFESGIPLSVFRLIYGLQFSELKSRKDHDTTCTITFTLSPLLIDNLMDTLIWETKKCNIDRIGDLISITIPKTSMILQGLDHKNPLFPKEVWHYLNVRSNKESVNVVIG